MRRWIFVILIFLLGLPAWAEEEKLSGKEIARRSQFRAGYKQDESTALQMRLINAEGKVRTREFLRYQKSFKSGKRTLMKFLYPNDIKDTGSLNEEVFKKDDIQYLYLPAAQKLRRVSAKSESWVGSDFNYEDLMEIEFDDYRYEAIGSGIFRGRDCYQYSMIPKKPEKSIYSQQIRWVTKDRYLPMKIEYFGKDGKPLKVIWSDDLREPIPGVTYAWIIVAENLRDGHRTELTRRWVQLDTGLNGDLLTTRHLQQSIDLYDKPNGIWSLWKESMNQTHSSSSTGPNIGAKTPA